MIRQVILFVVVSITCSFPCFADQPAADSQVVVEDKTTVDNQTVTENQVTAEDQTQIQTQTANDPLEGFNRIMFDFNDRIDITILKPIARLYNAILPKPLNQGIHNFFTNIGLLPTIANDILQLNLYQTANDSWRLLINTTIGIGGLFDVATRIKLKYFQNDFGLTMSRWGYKNSTYIVFPFFGPSTIRDGIGVPVDYFVFSIYPHISPPSAEWGLYGWSVVDKRAQLLKFQSVIEEAVLDKYTFARDAYLQRRAYQMDQVKNSGYRGGQEQEDSSLEMPLAMDMQEFEQQPDTAAADTQIPADNSMLDTVSADDIPAQN